MATKITSEVIENGAITDAKLASGISSSKLSGALPAIDGSSLTGISTYADSDVKSLFNVTGSAPMYACRAWVNFNGTGTVAIRASGNVSSITDLGTGYYRVNFSTAMPDANYSVIGHANHITTTTTSRLFVQSRSDLRATSYVEVRGLGDGGGLFDPEVFDLAIIR